jgi:hypothetical protein
MTPRWRRRLLAWCHPERVGGWARTSWAEILRLKEAILVTALCLWWLGQTSEVSRWAIYPYMLSKLTMLWILWHILYSATFPYLDLKTEIRRGEWPALAAAMIRAATCLAVVLGGALLL